MPRKLKVTLTLEERDEHKQFTPYTTDELEQDMLHFLGLSVGDELTECTYLVDIKAEEGD